MTVHRRGADPMWRTRVAAFSLLLALLLVAALFPLFPHRAGPQEGDVAAQTWQAPKDLSFESQTLTRQKREQAVAAVEPVLAYDQGLAPRQLDALTETSARISRIRSDPGVTSVEKSRVLSALEGARLSPQGIVLALSMDDDSWRAVSREAYLVLGAVMGQRLPAQEVAAARASLRQHIRQPLSEDQTLILEALVEPLVVANLVVDEAATQRARQAAAAAVAPLVVNLARGQALVTRGEVIGPEDVEALRAAALLATGLQGRDLASVVLVAALASGVLGASLYALRPRETASSRRLLVLALLLAAWTAGARFLLAEVLPDADRHFLAYLLPVAAAPMIVASLWEASLAVAVAAVLAPLATYAAFYTPDLRSLVPANPLDPLQMATVYLVASLVGAYPVHRAQRLSRYPLAGVVVAIASFAALLAFWLLDADRRLTDIPWIALAAGVGGLLSAMLAVGGVILLGPVYGGASRIHLIELAQPHHPLLRRLQEEAPGTFHHSLIVGNLAERAAELVGADALLVRVGAYYHDIGKLAQPQFYIENQLESNNPHDSLEPYVSAQRVIEHIGRGLELARSHHLPPALAQFIPEHHGTRLVTYFYRVASQRDPGVAAAAFAYPGPRPQSRETALVMLADSVEAVVRASEDRSPERVDALVDEVIAERLAEGQLDESDLTLRDLRTAAESFKATLRAVYHQRIPYPGPTAVEARQRAAAARLLRPSSPGDDATPPANPTRP